MDGTVSGARLASTRPYSAASASIQGLTLVHFSAQLKLFWSHLPVSSCLIYWG